MNTINTQLKTNCPSKIEIATTCFTFVCENFIRNSSTHQIIEGLKNCIKLLETVENIYDKPKIKENVILQLNNINIKKEKEELKEEQKSTIAKIKKTRKTRSDKHKKRGKRTKNK